MTAAWHAHAGSMDRAKLTARVSATRRTALATGLVAFAKRALPSLLVSGAMSCARTTRPRRAAATENAPPAVAAASTVHLQDIGQEPTARHVNLASMVRNANQNVRVGRVWSARDTARVPTALPGLVSANATQTGPAPTAAAASLGTTARTAHRCAQPPAAVLVIAHQALRAQENVSAPLVSHSTARPNVTSALQDTSATAALVATPTRLGIFALQEVRACWTRPLEMECAIALPLTEVLFVNINALSFYPLLVAQQPQARALRTLFVFVLATFFFQAAPAPSALPGTTASPVPQCVPPASTVCAALAPQEVVFVSATAASGDDSARRSALAVAATRAPGMACATPPQVPAAATQVPWEGSTQVPRVALASRHTNPPTARSRAPSTHRRIFARVEGPATMVCAPTASPSRQISTAPTAGANARLQVDRASPLSTTVQRGFSAHLASFSAPASRLRTALTVATTTASAVLIQVTAAASAATSAPRAATRAPKGLRTTSTPPPTSPPRAAHRERVFSVHACATMASTVLHATRSVPAVSVIFVCFEEQCRTMVPVSAMRVTTEHLANYCVLVWRRAAFLATATETAHQLVPVSATIVLS